MYHLHTPSNKNAQLVKCLKIIVYRITFPIRTWS